MNKFILGSLAFCAVLSLNAQEKAPENWFNLDFEKDNVRGVSTERAYSELIKDKKGQEIIVAVIDGGVDYFHEDLKNIMWVNKGEIPNNGKDDDGNGYIDDIHGWNFIGGHDEKGEITHVDGDNLEVTRVYTMLYPKYGFISKKQVAKADAKEYETFLEAKKSFEENLLNAYNMMIVINGRMSMISADIEKLKKAMGVDEITDENLDAFETEDEELKKIIGQYSSLKGGQDYFQAQLDYYYNPFVDTREIVGDNYTDLENRIYGNNDIKGPDSSHGTHVSGIIAAQRGNDLGMDGVANNVRIMGVRAVPGGDERDKDVANAVYYAVDNGAKIINMSFGKKFSPYKEYVDEAFKYAESKGVLLVHAAGNSAEDIDVIGHYPTGVMKKDNHAYSTWMDIGASDWKSDNTGFVADFSCYGDQTVDLFAPGVDIYATWPEQKYKAISGTSMATPVVSGVAALVWSYYPNLTAQQLREILINSGVDYSAEKVNMPGTRHRGKDGKPEVKMTKFSKLSEHGKIVNAYNALKLAETYK